MENTKPTISVVIPVYRAENILHELYSQINESFKKINIAYGLLEKYKMVSAPRIINFLTE